MSVTTSETPALLYITTSCVLFLHKNVKSASETVPLNKLFLAKQSEIVSFKKLRSFVCSEFFGKKRFYFVEDGVLRGLVSH